MYRGADSELVAVCVDRCDVSCRDASPEGISSGPEENPSEVWFWLCLILADEGPFKEDLCFFSGVVLLFIEDRVDCGR